MGPKLGADRREGYQRAYIRMSWLNSLFKRGCRTQAWFDCHSRKHACSNFTIRDQDQGDRPFISKHFVGINLTPEERGKESWGHQKGVQFDFPKVPLLRGLAMLKITSLD
jgi:hypothetical protein